MRNQNEQLPDDLRSILDAQIDYHSNLLRLHQQRRERMKAVQDGFKKASLTRAIFGMAVDNLDGPERELLEKCALLAGTSFDARRVFLPWRMLALDQRSADQRDLTVANAAGAGYLVATSNDAARDVLRGWSVTLSAGITVIDGLAGNLAVPLVNTAPTGYAISTESTAITESQPVLGQTALVPKTLACFVEFSRLLAKQANAESVIRMIMLSTLGKFLDSQILNGSGAAGDLMGIFNTAGLQTQSGTTLARAGVTTMKKLSAEAGATDSELAFVSTPAVRQLLENRESATGNAGFVWQNGAIADLPAYASNECPAASMLCGPWSQVVLGQWGPPGITLEINPFDPTGFKAGKIQARMILTVDAAVLRPSAFIKSTSIT